MSNGFAQFFCGFCYGMTSEAEQLMSNSISISELFSYYFIESRHQDMGALERKPALAVSK